MHRLAREQELKLIEITKKMLSDKSSMEEMRTQWDAMHSEGHRLAVAGSFWDALAELPQKGQDGKPARFVDTNPTTHALLMSGAMRSIANTCKHARSEAVMVRHVFLAPRLTSCRKCISTFMPIFLESDRITRGELECDLCLDRNVKNFYYFQVAYGSMIFYGDFCDSCRSLIQKPQPEVVSQASI